MSSTNNSATSQTPGLALAALGFVFGDIGTSPLYTLREVFSPASHHPLAHTASNVYGILSLITWSLILIVSIKYIVFIMRADNRGEGGIMALLALASRHAAENTQKKRSIMLLGILGACMFYADGMITPAISVLSAVESNPDQPKHGHAVAGLVSELIEAGMEYYFLTPLKQADIGFVAEKSARVGISSAVKLISSVSRKYIVRMDHSQLLVVSSHIKSLTVSD